MVKSKLYLTRYLTITTGLVIEVIILHIIIVSKFQSIVASIHNYFKNKKEKKVLRSMIFVLKTIKV